MGFFGQFFSFFRKKSSPELIENQLEERRLRPRVNPREGTRVLVIDDSPTILTAMKRFLESAHCVFLGALDAKMGMEVALTQKPDMIFLDIVMPGINGFAALRALRKNSRTRDIPIIMMSGNEQAKAQFFGAHIGADDFMKKPFSRFEVFARIARLLDIDRVPRRPPSASTPAQNAQPSEISSPEETTPQQPQTEAPPAPPSPPLARDTNTANTDAAPATSEEPPELVLTSTQIVKPPVVEASQPVEHPPESHIPEVHAQEEEEDEPTAPLQAQPEPSLAPTPQVSAQVVPIMQTTVMGVPHQSVSPELLTRIARLAQLAQSDPEALKALVVLSSQLAAQYAAAVSSQETIAQARASATSLQTRA